MCLVAVLRTSCSNWQCDGTNKEFGGFQSYLSDAIFSLFFTQIAFVCNCYIHSSVGKKWYGEGVSLLWFMKTQLKHKACSESFCCTYLPEGEPRFWSCPIQAFNWR